ncbi:hypothetical protein FOL47_002648, partial [Perkinsus chesapeaki]
MITFATVLMTFFAIGHSTGGSSKPGIGAYRSEDTPFVGDFCEESCSQTVGCDQSYCKENGLCFGLYHKGDSKCYQPGSVDNDCDDAMLEPVRCAEYPETTCQEVCDSFDSCTNSDWGTYCKVWLDVPVCFGIVKKSDGSLCFDSVDEE